MSTSKEYDTAANKKKGHGNDDAMVSKNSSKRVKLSWTSEKAKVANKENSSEDVTTLSLDKLEEKKYSGKKIMVRVTAEGILKGKDPGYVYKFFGQDNSGEVLVVGFRDIAKNLEKQHIRMNSLYEIKNFEVKGENPTFASGLEFAIEVVLNNESVLRELPDDDAFAPLKFHFKDFCAIQSAENELILDFIGVLFEVKDLVQVGPLSQKKRDLVLTDKSKQLLQVTMWGEAAEAFNGKLGNCIIIRKAVLKEYNRTKYLNLNWKSSLWMDPKTQEAEALLQWYTDEMYDVDVEVLAT